LYVGTLEPRKNIEGLLEAFAILKSRGFSHKLVIAGGKGWKYQNIFRTVSRLKLDGDVVFTGYVSDAEKNSLMRKAELFVYPSFYEGFGLPVLEAMALGTPVVTSDNSSFPEIVGDAGILVNPYDVNSIAGGMERALSSSISLINKGLKRAKLFTEERMISKILDVYEGVV
jgi:glycosyltransferase involved in cell wall biosynthesis